MRRFEFFMAAFFLTATLLGWGFLLFAEAAVR